jgi:DNA-binding XRE family transcriptional regulator/DNA-directed RNA polymerase subunit RPC12/RpoP
MVSYICPDCGWKEETAQRTDSAICCPMCDEQMQENEVENKRRKLSIDKARLHCLTIPSNKWRHIFICSTCYEAFVQVNYSKNQLCPLCNKEDMYLLYSYDTHNVEYNAINGVVTTNKESNLAIVDKLKEYQKEKRYSQSLMADILGISKTLYSFYLSGKRIPKANILRKINDL